MGKILKQLTTLSITLLMIGCSSVDQVEEVDDYNYKSVYYILKEGGEKHGLFQKFDPNGKLYESAHFANNQLHGERKIMYTNGQVEILEHYDHGNYEGISKIFYENGTLKNEGQYNNNVAEGIWKGYHSNGQIKEEVTYVDNQEEGPFKEWYDNGKIKAEGTYKNGDNEHGELKLYNREGELERKMDCVMGACSTTWKSETASEET